MEKKEDSVFASLFGFSLGCVSAVFLYISSSAYAPNTPNLLLVISVLMGALSFIIGSAYISLSKEGQTAFTRLSFIGMMLSSLALGYFTLNMLGILDNFMYVLLNAFNSLTSWIIALLIVGIYSSLLFFEKKVLYSKKQR